MKTWKVIYNLAIEDCKPGYYQGVVLASYKFKQMGIRFFTIDSIVEL